MLASGAPTIDRKISVNAVANVSCSSVSEAKVPIMVKRHGASIKLALHAGGAAFGTYVLVATDVSCKRKEVVIWNPKKEVLVLVILTWTFQILILCALPPMVTVTRNNTS